MSIMEGPKLRSDLVVCRQPQEGQVIFVIKDPVNSQYFRLNEPDYFIAAQLDGCLWRVLERDGKSLPGTMDYRQDRRNLGIRDGKVIWVRRG